MIVLKKTENTSKMENIAKDKANYSCHHHCHEHCHEH